MVTAGIEPCINLPACQSSQNQSRFGLPWIQIISYSIKLFKTVPITYMCMYVLTSALDV